MRMTPLPDSNKVHPDFFCSGCQSHKPGRLFSYGTANRKQCTTCVLPQEEKKKLGIKNLYENDSQHKASLVGAGKAYTKPLSQQALQMITGEHDV